jgi:hypothetical protein
MHCLRLAITTPWTQWLHNIYRELQSHFYVELKLSVVQLFILLIRIISVYIFKSLQLTN